MCNQEADDRTGAPSDGQIATATGGWRGFRQIPLARQPRPGPQRASDRVILSAPSFIAFPAPENPPDCLASCGNPAIYRAISHGNMAQKAVRWQPGHKARLLTRFRRNQPENQTMALPDFSMRQLLEAGVHFGHQSHRWNPKMADYIFGARNNIHIIDLAQTVPLLHRALQAVSDTVAKGGRILFVGTKRQAQDGVAEAAKRSAQYFVNSRWLGGTLTNWKTISGSIKRLRHLDEVLNSGDANAYTKKERLTLQRERDKLDRSLGGIKEMGGLPDMIFVIDTNKEDIAIQEAQRLNIPVAAIVDTNSGPKGITYVVPGNDDAGRAISLYCDLVARAAIDGISRAQGDSGMDIGASAHPAREEIAEAPQPAGFQGR